MGNLCSGGAAKQAKKEAGEENTIYEKKPKSENVPGERADGTAAGSDANVSASVEDSPTKSIAEKNAETRESWMAGAQKLIDQSATQEIQAKSQRIHESLAQKAKQAEMDLTSTGEEIKTDVAEAGADLKTEVVTKAEDIKDDVTQAAKDTVETVKTEASAKSEEFQASLSGFLGNLSDQGKAAATEAAVAVEDVKVGIEEEAARTTEKVESVSESVTKQAGDKIDNVQTAAAAGVEEVVAKMEDAKTSAEIELAQQSENVENRVKEIAKSAGERMESASSEVSSKQAAVIGGVETAQAGIKSAVKTQSEHLEYIASDASKRVEDGKQEINSASRDFETSVDDGVKDVSGAMGSEVDDKRNVIGSSVDTACSEFSEMGAGLKQMGADAAQSIKDSAQNVKTDVQSAIRDMSDSCEKKLSENFPTSGAKQGADDNLPAPYSGDEYKFDEIIDDLDRSKTKQLSNVVTNQQSNTSPVSIDRQNSELANVQREQIEVKRQNEFKVSAEDYIGEIPSELPPPPSSAYNQDDSLVDNLVSDLIETAKSAVTTSDYLGSSVDGHLMNDDLPPAPSDLMDFTDNAVASGGAACDDHEKNSVSGESQVSIGDSDDNMIEHIANQVTTQVVEEAMKIVAADGGNNPGSDHSEADMSGSMSSTSASETMPSPTHNKDVSSSSVDGNLSDVQKLQQLADANSGSAVDHPGAVVNNVDTKGACSAENPTCVNGSVELVGKSSEKDSAVTSHSTPVDVQKEAII